jgi:hypothetical protein
MATSKLTPELRLAEHDAGALLTLIVVALMLANVLAVAAIVGS